MRAGLFLLSMVFLPSFSSGECSDWYPGNLRLQNGEKIEGIIRYCLEMDLVMIKSHEVIKTFSPLSAESFQLYNDDYEVGKRFYALPFESKGYIRPRFFELLYDGKISLLNRGKHVFVTEQEFTPFGIMETQRKITVDKLYLLHPNGEIKAWGGNIKVLMENMGEDASLVKDFIDYNKLNSSNKIDLINILDYYNSMESETL